MNKPIKGHLQIEPDFIANGKTSTDFRGAACLSTAGYKWTNGNFKQINSAKSNKQRLLKARVCSVYASLESTRPDPQPLYFHAAE